MTRMPIAPLHRRAVVVVLGQHGLSGTRGSKIVELGDLHLPLEAFRGMQFVQQRRHPPREALRLPDARQCGSAVGREEFVIVRLVVRHQGAAEVVHVRCRKIQALGACRRHDVRGVADQEQAAMLHRR